MAVIRPFRAIRPKQEVAKKVAALPYDVLSSAEAKEIAKDNPYSFLHIDKAEIDLDPQVDLFSNEVYQKAKENLESLIHKQILIQDEKPLLYIYRLQMNEFIQSGLVFCASIDDYINGVIKKHELTREDKEQDRIRHVTACNANTGPIFLTYKDQHAIEAIINRWSEEKQPIYDFKADDDIIHTVWIIDQEKTIHELVRLFESVPSLYIADGHHRNASAVKVGLQKRQDQPYTGMEEFNYYLSVAFPASQLRILGYNRIVTDLNGLSEDTFLEMIANHFLVSAPQKKPVQPISPKTFGMYLNGQWYTLCAKEEVYSNLNVVDQLDVSLLQNYLLSPVLGIQDPRTDDRIAFVGGIRGLSELEKLVDTKKVQVAFSMYPTSIQEVMDIADQGEIMPPKSTWFEPKLRSGLFIHLLD